MSRSMIRQTSWLQLGERGVIAWAMGLVITGHMLPAGGIAAQEPAVPTLSVPATPKSEAAAAPAVEAPAPVVPEAPVPPAPEAPAAQAPAAQAPAAQTPATPVDPPKAAEAAAGSVASEALPVASVIPVGPEPLNTDERVYKFDDWTVTIRPAPKNVVRIPEATHSSVVPVSHVQVPVHVQVNNTVPMVPWNWSVDSTYTPWMQAPTSNYLFERPRPYWQLRGDFHHLRPYIRW